MNKLVSELNEQQEKACRMPLIPVLVLAGPGTGKTRVLIARIIHTIGHLNIRPENILALTFTNKAAHEMHQRLILAAGSKGEAVWTGTIHSFAFQMLRKYHERLGLNRHFTVCDAAYQNHLVAELCAPYIRENLDAKVRGVLLAFSQHAVNGKPLPQFTADRYKEYEKHLRKHNLVDFDQIIIFCLQLLKEHQDIRSEYQHLYQAILIDEFQDTDQVQYEILKALAERHRNIFIVADDDQSIYSWRGADPENIRKFMTDFQIKEPVILKINYRSGAKIIDAATRIIEKTERLERQKPLETDNEMNNNVAIQFFYNEKQEIDFLLKKISEWSDSGTEYRDIAVIYPYHRIGQALEQYFVNSGIPYQMARSQSLLDHPAIRKILLYLQLTRDPDDPIALEELTEQETGQAVYNLIKRHARQNKVTFRKALYSFYRNDNRQLGYDVSIRVQKFVMQLANIVNLRGFYRFNQLMSDIYRYVADNMTESLEQHIGQLQDITDLLNPETFSHGFDRGKHNKIVHEDPQVIFLASQILNRIGLKTAGPDEQDVQYLVLSGSTPVPDGKAVIPVYRLKNNLRRGSLSCLFKYLQWQLTDQSGIDSYVILDLETTDRDPETCDIVEFAAVRVRNGKIVDELTSLIKPEKPVSRGAQDVHGIGMEQLKNQPTIREFWKKISLFLGDDILIAHNGYNFDFPILDRIAREIDGKKLTNARFDTLVLARNLFPGESNSIDSLMTRFKITSGSRHRALEDVKILVRLFDELQQMGILNTKKISFEMLLDIVSLGNYIENRINETEDRLFFIGGARKLISPYSEIISDFCRKFLITARILTTGLLDQLDRIGPGYRHFSQDENLISRLRQMGSQFNQLPVDEAIAGFLGQISLQQAQDELNDINAVSLLTYHAAKGLEFDKVILIGLEKDNMPGFHAQRVDEEDDRPVTKKMEEQRRLFYVGMTRAKTELIMTAVRNRGGWERQSSPFLKDLRIGADINKPE